MQLAASAPASVTVAPPAWAVSATTAAPRAPRFSGGLTYSGDGSGGARFTRFAATATSGAYGAAAGYSTLAAAVSDLTVLTIGAHQGAAGIFERDGRFYGRAMQNSVTFTSGATWTGKWRLEQHPGDIDLLVGSGSAATTRAASLRAVVDGAQHVDVGHLGVTRRRAPNA